MQHFLPEVTAFRFAMCAKPMPNSQSRAKEVLKPLVSTGVLVTFVARDKSYPPEAGHTFNRVGSWSFAHLPPSAEQKTPVPCCHGTGAEYNFCGTTQIGALRPLCTHIHALRRGNGRGCRRLLLVAFRIALVRPFALSFPAAITPPTALFALPSGLLLLRIGLRCLISCNVPPARSFVNGFVPISADAAFWR